MIPTCKQTMTSTAHSIQASVSCSGAPPRGAQQLGSETIGDASGEQGDDGDARSFIARDECNTTSQNYRQDPDGPLAPPYIAQHAFIAQRECNTTNQNSRREPEAQQTSQLLARGAILTSKSRLALRGSWVCYSLYNHKCRHESTVLYSIEYTVVHSGMYRGCE